MPIVYRKKSGEDIIAIWDIKEEEKALQPKIIDDYFKNEISKTENKTVRLQRLAAKTLLEHLFDTPPALSKNSFGKPEIINIQEEISISHTENRAAVMISKFAAGLDIEKIKPKIEKIIPKFMSKAEQDCLSQTHRMEQAYVFWCAKEALYKKYSEKSLSFKEQLPIEPFDYKGTSGIIKGRIIANDRSDNYQLAYEKIDDFMLVYLLND